MFGALGVGHTVCVGALALDSTFIAANSILQFFSGFFYWIFRQLAVHSKLLHRFRFQRQFLSFYTSGVQIFSSNVVYMISLLLGQKNYFNSLGQKAQTPVHSWDVFCTPGYLIKRVMSAKKRVKFEVNDLVLSFFFCGKVQAGSSYSCHINSE